MNTPLVSVNLTTYNRAHLLPRALNSILDQTYPELEIIIVDDGSKDNTAEVVQAYLQKDERINFFRHEKNVGLSQARNTAWRNSHGKYVAFMDDDDEWIDRQKTLKQVGILEKYELSPVVLVCSSVRLFSDANTYRDKIIERPDNLKSIILAGNGIVYTPAVMVVKDVIEKVGGFNPKMPRGIDSDFYRTCIVKYGYDVHFMPEITTAVHEYGEGRITPIESRKPILFSLSSHILNLRKYCYYYFKHPYSLYVRFRSILFLLFKLVTVATRNNTSK